MTALDILLYCFLPFSILFPAFCVVLFRILDVLSEKNYRKSRGFKD